MPNAATMWTRAGLLLCLIFVGCRDTRSRFEKDFPVPPPRNSITVLVVPIAQLDSSAPWLLVGKAGDLSTQGSSARSLTSRDIAEWIRWEVSNGLEVIVYYLVPCGDDPLPAAAFAKAATTVAAASNGRTPIVIYIGQPSAKARPVATTRPDALDTQPQATGTARF